MTGPNPLKQALRRGKPGIKKTLLTNGISRDFAFAGLRRSGREAGQLYCLFQAGSASSACGCGKRSCAASARTASSVKEETS